MDHMISDNKISPEKYIPKKCMYLNILLCKKCQKNSIKMDKKNICSFSGGFSAKKGHQKSVREGSLIINSARLCFCHYVYAGRMTVWGFHVV